MPDKCKQIFIHTLPDDLLGDEKPFKERLRKSKKLQQQQMQILIKKVGLYQEIFDNFRQQTIKLKPSKTKIKIQIK